MVRNFWFGTAAICLTLLATACALSQGGRSTGHAETAQPARQSEPKVSAQAEGTPRVLTEDDLKSLAWRSVGPATMGGRVAALAFEPGNPKAFYVGYGTGGVWKTTNRGVTFSPVFDKEATSSIGSIVVADAPPNWKGWDELTGEDAVAANDRAEKGKGRIVWVGTGEGNGRNSSSWGNGVYRSTDGGGKFVHLGLSETHDIPSLAVDPRDPDVCYIAALGHLWGTNPERGVYKTSDGGKSWQHVLKIDEKTGACDIVLDPKDPNVVYAAMYTRLRSPWSFQSGGPNGGVYKSTDAGATWKKLTNGLPAQTGRIGLCVFADDPRIVMAVIESDEGGFIGSLGNDRSKSGGIFRSEDGGETWERTSDFNPRSFYFSRIAIDPKESSRVYVLGWHIYVSDDGGRNFRSGMTQIMHVDYHAIAINPDDTDHILVGNDGGAYVTYDRGKTWMMYNHMAVGQFYNVAVDDSDPYRVGGGLQDNGSWVGPNESIFRSKGDFMGRAGAITNGDWTFVLGGDGFHVAFDPTDRNVVYAEWQGGNVTRVHLDTGETRSLQPAPKEGQKRHRFNWNAPFLVSAHEPTTLYLGGNYVFKLTQRGDAWDRISDDLSSQDLEKVVTVGSAAETAGTVVSLAESPIRAGVLWAGTDDGLVHVTFNDGASWSDVTPTEVSGLYVADVEASHYNENTAYVVVDGHRSDVMTPNVLRTRDGGRTWSSIVGDLPLDAPVKTLREDPRNPEVLYAGTERAAFVTIDGGEHWVKLNGESLPTVAVDDLVIQEREMDLVAGTHGRSIWILDDASPLSQLTEAVLEKAFHVFEPLPAQPRYYLDKEGLWSDQMFIAENPPMGAYLNYWVRDLSAESVKIQIKDRHDHVVRELTGAAKPGINRVVWDLQADEKQRLDNPHGLTEFVPAGEYTAEFKFGEQSGMTKVVVLPAPGAGG